MSATNGADRACVTQTRSPRWLPAYDTLSLPTSPPVSCSRAHSCSHLCLQISPTLDLWSCPSVPSLWRVRPRYRPRAAQRVSCFHASGPLGRHGTAHRASRRVTRTVLSTHDSHGVALISRVCRHVARYLAAQLTRLTMSHRSPVSVDKSRHLARYLVAQHAGLTL